MLTLHRLPPFLRVLYVGIAAFGVLALASHWLRLNLRHGAGPSQVREWYLGNEDNDSAEVMLFERPWVEVADDSWHNLLHHTLVSLVLSGLLVRTETRRRTVAWIGAAMAVSIPATAAGPLLVRWDLAGAAHAYLAGLALLNIVAVLVAVLVFRDGVLRSGRGPRGLSGSAVVGAMLTLLLASGGSPLAAQDSRELMTEQEALVEAFPFAGRFERDTLRVDATLRDELEAELGRPIFDLQFVITRAYLADSLLGFAMVTDELGKYRPITMLVAANPDGSVRNVSILVYRESRGGEVARERFLRQYRGRVIADPIRINRDIINVAGATISVISVNQGVRKTLALIQREYQ